MKKLINAVFITLLLCTESIMAAVPVTAESPVPATAPLSQTIRGTVKDAVTGSPIEFASVAVSSLNGVGTITDSLGQFVLRNIPLGRHNIRCQYVGYEPTVISEILVTSAKESRLEIQMRESATTLNGVVIRAQVIKDRPLNTMVTTGGRMLSVEEAARYAGGFDDPARLASSFAGVSLTGATNGISIHGNAPHLLQWKVEDIEVPNPNHFSDVTVLGGGIFSSLSSQVIGNSDFLTSAFPAEYGNAVSGVFDMKMRPGNDEKYEHQFQIGVAGVEAASEGPIGHNGASYLVNYRYSMTGLCKQLGLLDMPDQTLDYQDLNFKVQIPTRHAGTFSWWGTGLIDNYMMKVDSADWKCLSDQDRTDSKQVMGTTGLSHQITIGRSGQIRTSLATSYSLTDATQSQYDEQMKTYPASDIKIENNNLIAKSTFQYRVNPAWVLQAGISYTHMFYDLDMSFSRHYLSPLEPCFKGEGNTGLLMIFTSHSVNLSNRWKLNAGLNINHLSLNGETVVEPRLGTTYKLTSSQSLSWAYGLHSRAEKTDVYFVKVDDRYVNRDLGFTKSHHLMMTYAWKMNDNLNFKIEPYAQYLYDVPVEANGSYSVLNRNTFYIDKALVNEGKGYNYGVDVTFERYLADGWYGMITASLFDSRYCGGDGKWHNTINNRHYILNGLIGKEWMLGNDKTKVLSANIKCTFQGGNRYTPVDLDGTLADQDNKVQYFEDKAYELEHKPMVIIHYTVSYRINRPKVSHEFAVKHINASYTKNEYDEHYYNYKTGKIEPYEFSFSLPNVSYKVEF